MGIKTNRRKGLEWEGIVRQWFVDRKVTALALSPCIAGDIVLLLPTKAVILEVKRVNSVSKKYYFGECERKRKQREQLIALRDGITEVGYLISWLGEKHRPITRYFPVNSLPNSAMASDGMSWEEFCVFIGINSEINNY